MKPPDLIDTTNRVQSVEITRVVCGELACFEIASAKIRVTERLRALPREKVKAQPAAVGRRDALRFSEKGYEQQKNQISVHLRLELQIARKIFRCDLADSAFELQSGMQRVIEFFNKRD